jgi:hypothetical protein
VVSDFYTPHFFDPVRSPGTRYGFGPHLEHPLHVLPGGYISWHEPVSDEWWQLIWFGRDPEFVNLGRFDASDPRSIREMIEARRPEARPIIRAAAPRILTARGAGSERASNAKALHWREEIQRFRSSTGDEEAA